MGISTIASYRGRAVEVVACTTVVELCLRGTVSRVSGCALQRLEADQKKQARLAFDPMRPIAQGSCSNTSTARSTPTTRRRGDDAAKGVQNSDYDAYKLHLVNTRPGGHAARPARAERRQRHSAGRSEPVEAILKRFDSAGMSLGARAVAGGARSAGRGDRTAWAAAPTPVKAAKPGPTGTVKMSGSSRWRLAVWRHPHYLVNAEVLRIKVARGARAGRRGAAAGDEVSPLIAKLRCLSRASA